ncbi:transposase [Pseudalkalibacillus caeni]|uniref:Transposase IS200-like domain-containing protein n=1 Tax=Exobacillus caeni TaxID=2574798 RepID=A0A5R9F7Z1_9BACL|nr:transposase [Pseudalkalibacillus caeni]TLS38639.1 hypothetical protein FCL54_03825 [Pseudalkalibacillus caeni]
MPRKARRKSSTGIYHVILRGINKQTIFEEDEDKRKFLETLKKYKRISQFELYSYCLMDNHVHLLIKESEETVSKALKRISSSYVYWYNMKYERIGHLFQERFKSETVETRAYFLTLGVTSNSVLQRMDREERDKVLARLKELNGVSIRQISRITGISKSVIHRTE